MKTIQSTLQLEQPELRDAISEYLKAKGWQLVDAIVKDNVIQVQVTNAVNQMTKSLAKYSGADKIKAYRKVKKHQKVNVGLFIVLKQWFAEERKAGTTEIPFHTIQAKLKANYPHLTEERLGLYLYDRRQLPDIRFKKSEGKVKFV